MRKDMSREGLAELAAYEAISTSPYLDSAGVKTVGLGSTVSDIPDIGSWPWDKVISIKEAVDIYKKGLNKYVKGTNDALSVPVSQAQFDALVCFAYNIGITGMKKSSLLRWINAGGSDLQIRTGFRMWNKITVGGKKVVSRGLDNRRNAEADLFILGKYKGRVVNHFPVNAAHKPVYSKGKGIDILSYI